MRQDREPTGLLDRQVETSNTSPNGTGALSVAGTKVITRSVATLKRLSQYFPERDDPLPQNLSRHAVMHRLPLEHMNDGHCIIAIMLMVSLLAELEWHMIQEQAEAWYEAGSAEEDSEGIDP